MQVNAKAARLIADNIARIDHPVHGRSLKLAGFGADQFADIRLQHAEAILHLLNENGFTLTGPGDPKPPKKQNLATDPTSFVAGVIEKVAREQAKK